MIESEIYGYVYRRDDGGDSKNNGEDGVMIESEICDYVYRRDDRGDG